jgi:hypothetical protein
VANITSKLKKKGKKTYFDDFELKQISQAYGSDGFRIKDRGVNVENYIDSYPDFKTWIVPTVELEEEIKQTRQEVEEKLMQ